MEPYYHIRITYGTDADTRTDRFTFYSEKETHRDDFDTAVKSINALYKKHGHFKSRADVVNHFAKYGFTQTTL